MRTQENPGEPSRAQETTGEQGTGEPRRPQESPGAEEPRAQVCVCSCWGNNKRSMASHHDQGDAAKTQFQNCVRILKA